MRGIHLGLFRVTAIAIAGATLIFAQAPSTRSAGEATPLEITADTITVRNLEVTGSLSKAAGTFKIDHPLDPENKYLYHSFVESPDMMNIYNGVVLLDKNGEAWVELPAYFEALNRQFRYNLTPIGGAAPNLHVAQEILGNRFRIAGGKRNIKVSWMVTGVRQDAYANAHRVKVEETKPAGERGKYLYPDVIRQRDKDRPANVRNALPATPRSVNGNE
jgi:hypothetical protein